MGLKYAEDKAIEKFNVSETFGILNFLDAELVRKWEDYVDEETGEERRRETDEIDYIDVKVYSSAINGDITVTVPAEANVGKMTAEKNYNDVVTLVAPTVRFWSNSEMVNGRRVLTSGVKARAKDLVIANQKAPEPKPEYKEKG